MQGRRKDGLWLVGCFLLSGVALLAPEPRAVASPRVPPPESVLGFVPGQDRQLADWGQVLQYLDVLRRSSARVRVEEVGKTTLGRPFVIVTVTSEANQIRLEEIRRDNARIADPRTVSEEDAEALVARAKTVVAMGFSIHSTEAGGTLSSLRLLHQLASAEDPLTRSILDGTVLLVLPSQNPDGTDIVADWYRRQLGTPFEGTAPPVLYHPYAGHDNNRDWYAFSLQETRLTVQHLHQRWHPQIVHDVHQMGSRGARLFLPPYLDPWEPNVDGALLAAVNALGSDVASHLTTAGRRGIVTRAIFDAWAPGRAYSHSHGGVRILSETASARIATPIEVQPGDLEANGTEYDPRTRSANFPLPWAGGTWGFADVVETQLAASLAILDHASREREHWLRTALAVNRRAAAHRQPFAFVIVPHPDDPGAADRLADTLRLGEVEVQRARGAFDAAGRHYEAGTLVVSMQQPASGFAKTILEPQRYPDLRGPDGSPKRPYDVAAHSLALLLGVTAEPVAQPFVADLEPAGEEHTRTGGVEGSGRYFALGHKTGELAALARLLRAGVKVRWALDRFEDEGRAYAPGTLLVPGSSRTTLQSIARELGLAPRGVRATPRSLRLQAPRVGVYRSWVPSMDEGWTRFVFDTEVSLSYRSLHDREVRGGGLRERFDAIVLPDQPAQALAEGYAAGSMPAEYVGGLGPAGAAALRAFVLEGGTLVALDSASEYAIEALRLPVRNVLAGVAPSSFFCPGSILRVATEPSQPLTHGLANPLPVWFEGSPAFELQGDGTVLARYEGADPLLSGLLLGAERLAGRAALVQVPLGRGKVVLFGFRPQYRAQSRVTYPALLNALYLSAARP